MNILNKLFEKVLVVNLSERCPERKEYMENVLTGVEFDFFEAVEGKGIDVDELVKNGIFDKDKSLSGLGRVIFDGEIGCALSHINIYHKIVNENIKNCVIIEDDVIISKELIDKYLEQSFNQLPADWDLFYLGYQRMSNRPYSNNLKVANFHEGTFGYAVSLEGAKKILEHNTPFFENADRCLIRMCNVPGFKAFVSVPMLINFTNNFKSSVWY